MRHLACLLLASFVLAGCTTSGPDGTSEPDPVEDAPFLPRVVVAVVDTGIMPYHEEFLQVREGEDGMAHPSTYLPGYPADAEGIPITLEWDGMDPDDLADADQDLWEATERGTLYWLPGTKFVGVVGVGADLPGGGHGSMTSSRAGGNTVSIAGPEVLLVHVRAPLAIGLSVEEDANARAVRWAAEQPWIDIQTDSWGWFAMCAGKATSTFWGWADAFRFAAQEHIVFASAGNGHGNGLGPGYPSECQDTAGIPGVISVGATDNAGYARWGNWNPHVSADGCANPAIADDTTDKLENTGSGTSSASPFSAGGAAKLILEARRTFRDPSVGVHDGVIATAKANATIPSSGPLSDGDFTVDDLKDVLFHTAVSPPTEEPSDGDACLTTQVPVEGDTPPESLYPMIGYGEVNGPSIENALAVLLGDAAMPERPVEDQLYAQDEEARRAMWGG